MAEKRKKQKKRDQDEPEKPTKEEYAVAKFLRFSIPAREGKLVGMTVQCFIASKAVDALLDSKWASKKDKKDALFTNRNSCVDYCNRLLQKGMFHRAAKVQKTKKELEKKKKKAEDKEEEENEEKKKKDKKNKKDKVKEKEKDKDKADKESEKKPTDEKKDEEKKKKREKKFKLEMHEKQLFVDGDEVFVWLYDPVPMKTFVIGLLLVLGATAVCLFPLWPPEVRLGIYYLSLVAVGFVGFIFLLCIVRLILFCLVWGATFGRHYFWFLPNLTEDVGFFESFKPLYKHDVCATDADDGVDKTDEKEDASAKNTETVSNDGAVEGETGKDGAVEGETGKDGAVEEGTGKDGAPQVVEKAEENKGSGSEANGGNGDNDNGYELIGREELQGADQQELHDTESKKDK